MGPSNNELRHQPVGQPANRPHLPGQAPENNAFAPPHDKKRKNSGSSLSGLRALFAILLVGIAVLVIALIAFVINNTVRSESSYVNKNDYQSVLLNVSGSSGGSAYFGHIQEINSQYIELTNVFYLEAGSTSNQFTLNNLSCALYNPQDTMIIKTDQVVFWENLKSTGQVTTDINKWYSEKLTCSTAPASNTTSTSSTTATTPTTTTPSSTTTKP